MTTTAVCPACQTVLSVDWSLSDGYRCICGAVVSRAVTAPPLPNAASSADVVPPPLPPLPPRTTRQPSTGLLPAMIISGGMVAASLIIALGVWLTYAPNEATVTLVQSERVAQAKLPATAPVREPSTPAAVPLTKAAVAATVETPASLNLAAVDPSVVTIRGHGSGFILDRNGAILTNHHVVSDAQSGATVVFSDGITRQVTGFVCVDEGKDLAIIKVDATDLVLKPARLATAPPLRGDEVWTLGAPHGLEGSAAKGVVSQFRSTGEMQGVPYRFDRDVRWIQTSAPINAGNSGGPLVNLRGEVVGVNTLRGLDTPGIGFAVDVSHVRELFTKAPAKVRPLADMPKAPVDPQQIIREKRERREREIEAERIAAAKRNAVADQQRLERKIADQAELNRINERMSTIRSQISVIEVEGTALTAAQGQVNAEAQAAQVRYAQLLGQASAIKARLGAIGVAIERRQLAMSSKFAPIYTDGESATFDANGVAQLQREQAILSAQLPSIVREGQTLESAASGIATKLRQLQVQIEYKASLRAGLQDELRELAAKYEELSRK